MIGKKLGHYEILEKVGQGGMGEVYRARDTRLDRAVAIKVLPGHLSAQHDLRQRFEREARTISSLTHPRICTLYDIGDQDGTSFLVMEYLEGETLEKRIRKGPLPADQALRLATETAEALDRAHRQGIVHRDLKPGNIMLTKSGAKLLDFGLAKLKPPPVAASAALTEMATESRKLTEEGMILGTLQYMSPEQLEGKEADARTDIFALGAVMFEMVTGRAAFTGKSKASLIAAILAADPPPISQLQPMTPPALDRAVKRCLAKDPDERWQTARDLAAELKWIAEGSSVGAVYDRREDIGAHRAPLQQRVAWALASAFLVAAIFGATAYFRLVRAPAPVVVADVSPPQGTQFNFLGGGPPALSPDGHAPVISARDATGKNMLWVRRLDASSAQPLPETEGAVSPFWSADNRMLGFFADRKLKVIEASGGPPVVVSDAPASGGGTWNREGTILFAADGGKGIDQVASSGGAALPVIRRDTPRYSFYFAPKFLPDGKHFLYEAANPGVAADTYFASLDGKENRLLLPGSGRAVFASEVLLYRRDTTLVAQPFDPARGRLRGASRLIVERVGNAGAFLPAFFSASQNGVLVYQPGSRAVAGTQLTWFERAGKRLTSIGGPTAYYDVRLSPDARRLASAAGDPRSELSVDDLVRGVRMRLTFDPDTDKGVPVWSPDGSRILFSTLRGGKARIGIYQKALNGAGNEELLLPSDVPDQEVWATDWSRDGRFVLFSRGDLINKLHADIWVLPLTGDRKPRLFLHPPASAYDAAFSPDGRWVAYTSRESGREEVYVVPFDAAKFLNGGGVYSSPGGKWQISSDGGDIPRWRRDGKELFYLSPNNNVMAAEVDGKGNSFEVGRVQPLFTAHLNRSASAYDVAPDGKRFVVNVAPEEESLPLTLVVNWTARVKDK